MAQYYPMFLNLELAKVEERQDEKVFYVLPSLNLWTSGKERYVKDFRHGSTFNVQRSGVQSR